MGVNGGNRVQSAMLQRHVPCRPVIDFALRKAGPEAHAGMRRPARGKAKGIMGRPHRMALAGDMKCPLHSGTLALPGSGFEHRRLTCIKVAFAVRIRLTSLQPFGEKEPCT
jgi:hypothetical protein